MKHKLILLLLLFTVSALFGQDDKTEPSWVFLKQAENLKEKGEYAQAITLARKARRRYIEEQLVLYHEKLIELYQHEKTDYEIKKILSYKEQEIKEKDNYPAYHELMGDLFLLTSFLEEAESEYKLCLDQREFLDYKARVIEIKYKLAKVYSKRRQYDLEDIVYREILEEYFMLNNKEYWDRINYNINKDQTLGHVFRIYRVEGIEFLEALYKVGRRSALLQKKKDALFYLSNAAIVWMTYYSGLIKTINYNFQFTGPFDFINYLSEDEIFKETSEGILIDEIMFYIGYIFYINRDYNLAEHYFKLAESFSKNTTKEVEIKSRIIFLMENKDHILSYEEILN